MLRFLAWLVELILPSAVSVWLASRKNTAEQLGQAETKAQDAEATVDALKREAQAAANAPISNADMAALLDRGKL